MQQSEYLPSEKKNLISSFAIYVGTSVINSALPFLLIPILTRYLSTAEYGLLAIYQVMISFTTAVIGMNLQTNITRNFFSHDKDYIAQTVWNLIVILVSGSSFFLILISVYFLFNFDLFLIPARWVFALPLIACSNSLNQFNLTILRNKRRAYKFGLFEILRTLIDLSITLFLVVVLLFGWEGRSMGILVGSMTLGIISLISLRRNGYILYKLKIQSIREILRISTPLIPHALGTSIITLSDRLFIQKMVSNSEAGIYTVGYQFGMIMLLIITAFNRSWSPWIYKQLAKNSSGAKNKIVKSTYFLCFGFVGLAIVTGVFSHLIFPMMTSQAYSEGVRYVSWIALGYSFQGMYMLVFPYGVHMGKTNYLALTTSIAAIINLILNYYLIRLNGTIGAAQATLFSYFIMFVLVWFYSNKIYSMPWFSFAQKERNKR